MADRLRFLPRALPAFRALAAHALVASAAAFAQTPAATPLADPTRPPAGVLEADGPGEAAGGPVLQSVLIPRQGKPLAVIDGQQVRLGQRYGDARLIKLSEREAVLEGPQGVERLLLTPGIEKTNICPANVTKGAKSARSRRSACNEG